MDFRAADLSGAGLKETNLRRARFVRTNRRKADFSGATMSFSTFGDVDLSVVKGLDAVLHAGPSSIDVDTIYRSGGNLPKDFLEAAGTPSYFTDQVETLVDRSAKFFSCFISHRGSGRPGRRLNGDANPYPPERGSPPTTGRMSRGATPAARLY